MTWVKICGITNLEDAKVAVDAGADALGFVFYEKSPRYLDPAAAREIIDQLPASIATVGVFGKASVEQVRAATMTSGAGTAQVSVDVEPADGNPDCPHCFERLATSRIKTKLIPVLSMHGEKPEGPAMMWNPGAVFAFLLDSGGGGLFGGTGQQFDWKRHETAVQAIKRLANVVVAGGLTPSKVTQAMDILKPWGVDVSSGVEARPGKKDPEKVRAFIHAVRQADKNK